MPNMEATRPWETTTSIAKQTNKTHLQLYPFDRNKQQQLARFESQLCID